jgi:SsrA-binding protein
MNERRERRGDSLVASNRKARHDFEILEVIEAGIVLTGSEVKSARAGQVQLADGYARAVQGRMLLEAVHIAPYSFAHGVGSHDPVRSRVLLLHRQEIRRLADRMARERLTLVPLEMAFRNGRVKVDLGLAKGRTKGDRRQAIAKRESELEMRRAQRREQR